jgi:hypothetical protein
MPRLHSTGAKALNEALSSNVQWLSAQAEKAVGSRRFAKGPVAHCHLPHCNLKVLGALRSEPQGKSW